MESQEKRYQFVTNDYVKIEIIGLVRTPPHCVCGAHRHPFWELIYTLEGEGVHQFPGREIALAGNDICLIPPDVLHDCRNEKASDNTKLYIGFSYNYSLCGTGFREEDFFSGNISHLPLLRDPFAELCGVLLRGTPPEGGVDVGNIISLVTHTIRLLSPENRQSRNLQEVRKQNLVEQVKDYLNANLCRNIRLEELGAMFYLSPHYISDSFRKITGLSIKQYHDRIRMRYASQLLAETGLSVSEISDKLGFESIHYFSRRYKERYGFSPSAAREKQADPD